MPKKALLVIAAVAVMLMAATSAYGDDYTHERWDGWFNSGHLNYNSKTYTIVESYRMVEDSTYTFPPPPRPGRDTFYLTVDVLTFVCAAGYNDSIFVCIPTFTGGKEYGTSGTHEGSGLWSGSGYSDNSAEPETKLFDFWGTWASTGNDFNYDSEPDPTYTADWDVTGSNPPGITGDGTCSGHRTYYR